MNQFAEKAQEKPASPQPRKLKTPKEENDFLSIFALYLGFIAAVIALIVGLVLLNKGAISAKLQWTPVDTTATWRATGRRVCG